jgi:hypothetical protein
MARWSENEVGSVFYDAHNNNVACERVFADETYREPA